MLTVSSVYRSSAFRCASFLPAQVACFGAKCCHRNSLNTINRRSTNDGNDIKCSWCPIIKRTCTKDNKSEDGSEHTTKRFPSFSTTEKNNFEGLISKPPLLVYANVITTGAPNTRGIENRTLEVLGQSPDELLEGALSAIGVVTESLSRQNANNNQSELEDLLTHNCHSQLLKSFALNDSNRSSVSTPKEDIFFSWIHSMSIGDAGNIAMNICTLSFPQYGVIIREEMEINKKRKVCREKYETDEGRKEFVRYATGDFIKRKLENPNISHFELIKMYMKQAYKLVQGETEIENRLYHPNDLIKCNDIIISNFLFKRDGNNREKPWLIDAISMRNAKETYLNFEYCRWRGRMLQMIGGRKLRHILMLEMPNFGFVSSLIGMVTV